MRLPWKQKRIYLDHGAATPLRPSIAKTMRPYEREVFGNASAVHKDGVMARAAIETARGDVGRVLATTTRNIIFTSGGTESNNLAVHGVIEYLSEQGRAYSDMEVITTALEHPSLLAPLEAFERKGVRIVYAPTDSEGSILEQEFKKLITDKTVLVTFAYANSEVGTVQNVKSLSRMVRLWRQEHGGQYPYTHIDASQVPLWLPCKMDSLGIDLMSIDAGKCYGPKSSGVLALRGEVHLAPLLRGGAQEGSLRPGTEHVGLIVGCAAALTIAQDEYEVRASRITKLRDQFITGLQKAFPSLVLNGSRTSRVANNVNISIPGLDGEYAVIGLDHRGIACSTRSACKRGEVGGSHVLRALGLPDDVVFGAIRFSLGEETTEAELRTTVTALREHTRIAMQ